MGDTCTNCGEHVVPEESGIHKGHRLCCKCLSGASRHANTLIGVGALVVVAGAAVIVSGRLSFGDWPWQAVWEDFIGKDLPTARGMWRMGHYMRFTFVFITNAVALALNLIPVIGVFVLVAGLVAKWSVRKALSTVAHK